MGDAGEKEFRSRDKATCILAGSKCDAYLLEKNRVTDHDPEERTYHIFYQIIANKNKTKYWDKLAGSTNEDFKIIGPAPTDTIEGMKDTDHFDNTVNVLKSIGINEDNLVTLMQAEVMVLQMGNITYQPKAGDSDKSEVKNKKDFADLSELMCIPQEAMEVAFTERTMKTRNETYKVPLNPGVARESTEAFAREIYARAFLWLVRAINDATAAELNYKSGTMDEFGVIGLLDIFGFESFVRNRFGQLCINYANEKLQAKFTEDIFRSVQEEYERQGIPLDDITYDDNTDVLDLIEGKTGLLAMLNEECVRPKGTDEAFVSKALAANKGSPCLFANKVNKIGFGIHHYAGKVMYDAVEFVASNQDTLPTDLDELAKLCNNDILQNHMTNDDCQNFKSKIRGGGPAPAAAAAPKRAKSNLVGSTVWNKYKTQLLSLMNMLKTTQSKYIRCIKPNAPKKPILMQHMSTIEQLRCAGVVAAVTLARSAFPNRLENSGVKFKFTALWDREKYPSKSTKDMDDDAKLKHDCEALLECALKPMEETDKKTGKIKKVYAVGKTISYFKMGALEFLEANRMAGLVKHAVEMQRIAKGFLARKRIMGSQRARKFGVQILQKWMKCMIAKMKALKLCEKARKEKAAMEIKRLKEAEENAWKIQLEREIKEREASANKEYKIYEDRLAELKEQLKEAETRATERQAEATERLNEAKNEAIELKEKLETEIKVAAQEPAKIAAAQKTKLEESGKLIAFLQKENKKLKSANEKAKKEVKKVKETNERLMKANESAGSSFEMLNSQSKKLNSNTGNINSQIEKYKDENNQLREDLKSRQQFYNTEANIRLQYQKTMAQILDVFQDNCKDADLVEDVVCLALECESEAKAALAAAEASAPDLM
jgi:myosin-5